MLYIMSIHIIIQVVVIRWSLEVLNYQLAPLLDFVHKWRNVIFINN